jgi:hypothetical protein
MVVYMLLIAASLAGAPALMAQPQEAQPQETQSQEAQAQEKLLEEALLQAMQPQETTAPKAEAVLPPETVVLSADPSGKPAQEAQPQETQPQEARPQVAQPQVAPVKEATPVQLVIPPSEAPLSAEIEELPAAQAPEEPQPAVSMELKDLPKADVDIPPAVTEAGVTPVEADHPLYLAGIMLYPVGRLLELVIVKPIIFVFDHPFTRKSDISFREYGARQDAQRQYSELREEYEELRGEYEELRQDYEELHAEYQDLRQQNERLQ